MHHSDVTTIRQRIGALTETPVGPLAPYWIAAEIDVVGDPRRSAPDYIQVKPFGRLGNNLIQMVNAIHTAETLGVSALRHPFFFLDDFVTASGVAVTRADTPAPDDQQGLRGMFFYDWSLAALKHFPPHDAVRILTEDLRPAFRLLPVDAAPNRIAVHLRSGDIFREEGPINANFGPPPLSFFQTAITKAMQDDANAEIVVVHEDRKNPLVDALQSWLQDIGAKHRMASDTMEADARTMMAAPVAIYGFTSFAETLSLLSPHTRSVWLFRRALRLEWLRAKARTVWLAEDARARYFAENAWANSDDQKRLMLNYPAENLKFRDISR